MSTPSLLLLIDGYNLSQPVVPQRRPPPDWLQRHRERLLKELAEHLGEPLRRRTCVVFDAANPPPDRPDAYRFEGMRVRFSRGYNSADELIQELIRQHHTPKRLAVISSDHQIQTVATGRGATVFESQPWLDDLVDGKIGLAARVAARFGKSGAESGGAGQGGRGGNARTERAKPRVEHPDEVAEWMQQFGFDPE
jgi:predicted RNA-binding protein with PIN domain